jgi:hypothetical protein
MKEPIEISTKQKTYSESASNLVYLISDEFNLEEPISSGYPAHLGLTWRNQFLLVTQPTKD